ncbi:MAG TPA: aminotransferase class V-fold PLP-dependent enzyme [Tepidisphaeraceae bacterium]|jgi:selenocysteine lyase/cysteine desulfurase
MPDLQHYAGNTDAFPILGKWDFFNHAGVCPLPRVVSDAIRAYADRAQIDSYLTGTWYKDIENLRVLSAGMLNCHRDEIAFVKNTGEGLSIVANGIDFRPGDRIVTTAVEYPANIYPWMEQARRHGCELVMVPEETDTEGRRAVPLAKILEATAHSRTRLVTLSHVEYASGQRLDIAQIGKFCREQGKLFCVDAIQSLGVIPVDVQAMNIDFLSADGHKWLLGPEGAGIFYIRRDLIESTRPLSIGSMNVINHMDYGHYDYTLKSTAGRYECGTYNVPGLHGLNAAVKLLIEVSVEKISERLLILTSHFIRGLEQKGYNIISPRTGDQWSGSVAFASPIHDHQQIVTTLRKQHHTEIALRESRLRCSPHFYNTLEQLERLLELLPRH